MIDFVKVGAKITKYHKELCLTQDDIAEKLYVSRQLVSKWENGIGIPSIDVLFELCKMIKITFEELLCFNDEVYVDENDVFKGRNRLCVVHSVVDGKINVNLPEVFYQFSPIERMIVLKAIKEGRVKVMMDELYPKLTLGEQKFLRKDEKV